jgi:plasmid stabilization system protein ParE
VDLRFTPSAKAQFLHAVETIRQNNRSATMKFRRRAETALRRLSRFPSSGATIAEFPEVPSRGVYVRPCRFFYRIDGNTVWVVAIWHGGQVPDEPESK